MAEPYTQSGIDEPSAQPNALQTDFANLTSLIKPNSRYTLADRAVRYFAHFVGIEDLEGVDFRMRIFNADGSEAAMCGNGARALARYAYKRGIAASPMRFATGSGTVEAEVEPPFVELDMGNIDLARGTFGWSLRHYDACIQQDK